MVQKVGVIAMSNLSVGGGYARVVNSLINHLNDLGKKVYLLTSSEIDVKKIENYHGKFKVEKLYQPKGIRKLFCREETISRILMKPDLLKMLNEVDFIIDVDGRVLDKYIPAKDKHKYVIWRVSCAYPDTKKFTHVKLSFTRKIKEFVKDFLYTKMNLPGKDVRIYPLDKWTGEELIKYWDRKPMDKRLYAEIKVEEFLKWKGKKKKQIAVFGRIAPNKMIDDSIKIFANGTKNHPEYNLIILGGLTPDSESYIKLLKDLIEKLNLKDRVEILGNPSFEKLKNVLLDSEIVVDSQWGTSHNMTSMEALAAGAIVLAHKNGGTYTEILDNGKYGFGASNVEEGSQMLNDIIKKIKSGKLNGNAFRKRTSFFDEKAYRDRLKAILKENNAL
ncbi:MAG: glycosyltransferase [Nanoarchaeota archaeon]